MTTVEELIDILKAYNPNHIVLLSSDAEGNRFNPLDSLIAVECMSKSDGEWDYDESGQPTVILFPI